MNIIDHHTVV